MTNHKNLLQGIHYLPLLTGIIAAALGVVVMVGWHIKSIALVQVTPVLAPMQHNTALCISALGIALIMIHGKRDRMAAVVAALAGIIAGLSLMQYVIGVSIGLDTLFAEPFTVTRTSNPGRMSPGTGLAIIFGAVAIGSWGIRDIKPLPALTVTCCVALIVLSGAALISYSVDTESTRGWAGLARVALHTALGTFLIGCGFAAFLWRAYGYPQIASMPSAIPVLLYMAVFVVDLVTPVGVSIPILYTVGILCALQFRYVQTAFVFAAVASFLTVIGYFNAPVSLEETDFTNRLLAILEQWITAFIIFYARKAKDRADKINLQMEATLMNVFGAIITIDLKGTIQLFNPMAERIFGYEAAEVIGKNVNILMPEPYHNEHDNYLKNYLTTQKAKIIGIGREVMARRKDGSVFPVELGVSKGEVYGRPIFVGLLHDISARKEAEKEVQKRTEELEYSNKELDNFAYIASHDLKEPLRGIHNYASFLLEDYGEKLDEDGRQKLETLTVLTQRLEALINALLYYSRVGRAELAMQDTELNPLIEEVEFSLKPYFEHEKVEIRHANSLPRMVCDAVKIGELFRNLITNAVKYNDKEKKWVEVGCFKEDNGKKTVFYVKDNGIGIPEKHWEDVFRIFRRLHAKNKYGGGTGSGLTIAKKIVERHNGRIWIESQPEEGTTVYFTLEP